MAGRIALEIEYPDGRRETYRFDKDIIRIGGGSEVEIRLQGLPPLYAVLKATDDRVVIKPTEGAKVLVNGKRLILPKVLSDEDVIEVGDYRIRVLGVPKPGQFEDHTPTEFIELPAEIIPRLVVIEGPDKGAEFELLGTALVGRDPTTDFTLTDPAVSRHHVRLSFNEEGDVVAEDLGGRNPMLVNGRRTPRKRLRDGDIIQIGKTKILFKYPIAGEELAQAEPQPQRSGVGRWLWLGALGVAALVALGAGLLLWKNAKDRERKVRQLERVIASAQEAPAAERARLYAVAESLAREVEPLRAQEFKREKEFWGKAARAESLFAAGAWEEALGELKELLKERPSEGSFKRMAAEAERALELERVRKAVGSNPRQALAEASAALERYPDDPEFLKLYAEALGRLKASAVRGATFRKLSKVHSKGNPRRVLELADSVLAREPGSAAALFFRHLAKLELRALELEAQGDADRAKVIWKAIREIDPKNPLAGRRLK